MKNNQTAVEWLKRQYIERGETLPSGVFQEALEMEKEQIEDAIDYCRDKYINSENYYNETYGK